jgi:hypothetical protein
MSQLSDDSFNPDQSAAAAAAAPVQLNNVNDDSDSDDSFVTNQRFAASAANALVDSDSDSDFDDGFVTNQMGVQAPTQTPLPPVVVSESPKRTKVEQPQQQQTQADNTNPMFSDYVLPDSTKLFNAVDDVMLLPALENEPIYDFLNQLAGLLYFDCTDNLFCVDAKAHEVVWALKIRAARNQLTTNVREDQMFKNFMKGYEDYVRLQDNLQNEKKLLNIKRTPQGENPIDTSDIADRLAVIQVNENKLDELEDKLYEKGTKLPANFFLHMHALQQSNKYRPLVMRLALFHSRQIKLKWSDYSIRLKPPIVACVRNAVQVINEEYSRAKTGNVIFRSARYDDIVELLEVPYLRETLLDAASNKHQQAKSGRSVSQTDRARQDLWEGEKLIRKKLFNFFRF